MNTNDAFPSKYVSAGDLHGQPARLTIASVRKEEIGQGDDKQVKPVIGFAGKDKGLACNRVNWKAIAKGYGDESDNWIGKTIELFPTTTEYKGEIVDCLRVRIPAVAPAPAPAPDPVPESAPPDGGDDIPF